MSWPITLATFVLFDAQPRDADAVRDAVRFFYWSFMHGDRLLEGTGLPTSIQARLMSRLQAIRPQDGSDVRTFMR
jgi:phosphate transport system substrate-binding protein